MLALWQRSAYSLTYHARLFASSQLRQYASNSHHQDHGHQAHCDPAASESMGKFFFILASIPPACVLLHYASQPNENGNPPRLTHYLEQISSGQREQWVTYNSRREVAIEQAVRDRFLLQSVKPNEYHDLNHPEQFQHGSPYNVPAGHYINLDRVIEHYRQKYHDEEERKAKRLAAIAAAASPTQTLPAH